MPREILYLQVDDGRPLWRLSSEVNDNDAIELPLQPRMSGSCLTTLKRAAELGLGVVALPKPGSLL